jgi:hypothetical protein
VRHRIAKFFVVASATGLLALAAVFSLVRN